MKAFRCDEAINRKGEKVRVKFAGSYFDRNHLKGDYYLFYDEAEVYHIENKQTKKIIFAFSCNSWVGAEQVALMRLSEVEQ